MVPLGDDASARARARDPPLPDEIENNPPGFDDDAITGGRAQSYGQFVKAGLKAFVPSPGEACRGNVDFEE